MRHNCSFVKGCFTGDPLYEYEHTETKKAEGAVGKKLYGAEEENIVKRFKYKNFTNDEKKI